MKTATRIDFRVDKRTKALIERAASLRGQTLSDFAKVTLLSKAQQVLKQEQQTVLSDRDRDIFLALLDADVKPNAALRRAARLHRQAVGE